MEDQLPFLEMERWTFEEEQKPGFSTLEKKDMMNLLVSKWGLSDMVLRSFVYTGEIPVPFNPSDFFLSFFQTRGLSTFKVESLVVEELTANTTGKGIWKKLWTPPNNIMRNSSGHYITKCPDHHVRGMWLSDCLQVAIFDEDSEEYDAFTPEDRKELIFNVMKSCVIGGQICQYEDEFDVYEPVITSLYKDLVGQSVVKTSSGAISVVARAYILKEINQERVRLDEDRSFCFLVIDTVAKKVRLMSYNCAY